MQFGFAAVPNRVPSLAAGFPDRANAAVLPCPVDCHWVLSIRAAQSFTAKSFRSPVPTWQFWQLRTAPHTAFAPVPPWQEMLLHWWDAGVHENDTPVPAWTSTLSLMWTPTEVKVLSAALLTPGWQRAQTRV